MDTGESSEDDCGLRGGPSCPAAGAPAAPLGGAPCETQAAAEESCSTSRQDAQAVAETENATQGALPGRAAPISSALGEEATKEMSAGAERKATGDLQRRYELIEPRMVWNADESAVFEVSAHAVPRALRADVKTIFSSPLRSGNLALDALKIVPTIQKTRLNILTVNAETAIEKDDCLEQFAGFAETFCRFLEARGHWADFCDPCSGLPVRSGGTAVYSEIQGLEKVRRFHTTNAGSCRVALHPLWGSNMYPASMFTTAPVDLIEAALEHCSRAAVRQDYLCKP